MPELKQISEGITRGTRDVVYVAVGLGVLGFQRAQVRRQELSRRLSDPKSTFEGRFSAVRGELAKPLLAVDDALEQVIGRFEASFERIEDRLPAQARDLVVQIRTRSREAREHIRNLVTNRAA